MIPVVIYSNTDFLDILNIQHQQMIGVTNKYLLINNTDKLDDDFYRKYNGVYFYNEQETYASRLLNTVNKINCEYFLWTHENDIFISGKFNLLKKLISIMKKCNIDRINLQANGGNVPVGGNECIEIDENKSAEEWIHRDHGFISTNPLLMLHNAKGTYQYNVNPALWKKETFLELLNFFKNSTYRSIEYDVVDYVQKFRIYNFNNNFSLNSGYQRCTPIYKYLHVTHHGKLLRHDESMCNEYGQSYSDLYNDYTNIIIKHNLKNSSRQFS
jgi:hypothetical protein